MWCGVVLRVVGCGKERGGIWDYEGRSGRVDRRSKKYMFGFGVKVKI